MDLSILKEINKMSQPIKKITLDQYHAWKHEFIFDQLRDQRYGQSFCNYFDVTDNILHYSTMDQAHRYIIKTYIEHEEMVCA